MLDAFFSEFFFFATGRQLWLLYSLADSTSLKQYFKIKIYRIDQQVLAPASYPAHFVSLADSFIA